MPRKSSSDLYKSVQHSTGTVDASPHRLIAILLEAAVECVEHASAHTRQKNYEAKAQSVGKAMDIITLLQASLDFDRGGEIAANLDRLYTFSLERLALGSASLDVECFRQVAAVLREILAGWQGIASN